MHIINSYELSRCRSHESESCIYVDVVEISDGNLGQNYYLNKLNQTGEALLNFYESLAPLGTAVRYYFDQRCAFYSGYKVCTTKFVVQLLNQSR
jgi:hypothetical protein